MHIILKLCLIREKKISKNYHELQVYYYINKKFNKKNTRLLPLLFTGPQTPIYSNKLSFVLKLWWLLLFCCITGNFLRFFLFLLLLLLFVVVILVELLLEPFGSCNCCCECVCNWSCWWCFWCCCCFFALLPQTLTPPLLPPPPPTLFDPVVIFAKCNDVDILNREDVDIVVILQSVSHCETLNWSCSIGFFIQLPKSSRRNALKSSCFAIC